MEGFPENSLDLGFPSKRGELRGKLSGEGGCQLCDTKSPSVFDLFSFDEDDGRSRLSFGRSFSSFAQQPVHNKQNAGENQQPELISVVDGPLNRSGKGAIRLGDPFGHLQYVVSPALQCEPQDHEHTGEFIHQQT